MTEIGKNPFKVSENLMKSSHMLLISPNLIITCYAYNYGECKQLGKCLNTRNGYIS